MDIEADPLTINISVEILTFFFDLYVSGTGLILK